MIKDFRNDYAVSSFIIQILEIFPATGYKNNEVCPTEHEKRLKREDYWMKTLRSIYPCGLNERVKKYDRKILVRQLFLFIPRTKQQSARYRNNNGYLKNDTITDFFTKIHNIIQNYIKDSLYKMCISLNNLKKKILKQTASEILRNGDMMDMKIKNHFHNYVLDIIDTKTYKFNQITQN